MDIRDVPDVYPPSKPNTTLVALTAFVIGVAVGAGIMYLLALNAVEVVGSAFRVENINMTLAVNESKIIEAMQEMAAARGGT